VLKGVDRRAFLSTEGEEGWQRVGRIQARQGIIIRKRNRCRYLCREIAVGPISVWLTHKVIFESIPRSVSTRHAAPIEITLSVNHTIQW